MKLNLRLTLKIKRMSVLTFPWLYLVAKTVNKVVTKLLDLFSCWSVIICTKFGRQTKNRSKLNINYCRISVSSQLIFTCSKSTIETVEKGVNMFKFNNKNTRMTSMTSFWCFYCWLWIYFTHFLVFLLLTFNKRMLVGLWHFISKWVKTFAAFHFHLLFIRNRSVLLVFCISFFHS